MAPKLESKFIVIAAIIFFACLLTFFGWQLLWFLTDDAFISFRYVSNWVAGLGATWNPSPFSPVEGYSNFSWVALLSLIWWATGIEPPDIANNLLFVFGLVTLLLSSWWSVRILYRANDQDITSHILLALGLLLLCTNKSFLTWLSSGLETSLFTMLVMAWAYALCGKGGALRNASWFYVGLLSSMLALSRPDGLLFWGISGLAYLFYLVKISGYVFLCRRFFFELVAFAIVPLHLLWRRMYYNDWLPNTYYAKVGDPWPDMGVTYLLSYVLEYALYWPAVFVVYSLIRHGIKGQCKLPFTWIVVYGTVSLEVTYYVLIVGGDHFEYRVWHHLIPLTLVLVISCISLVGVNKLSAVFLVIWLVMQSVIPWTHWYYAHDLKTRQETLHMVVPIAERFPKLMQPLVEQWDQYQRKMIEHSVGLRHQEHKIFYLFQRALFPSREKGLEMALEEHNVFAWGSIGVPGWVLPKAIIIDTLGLNDRILAKSYESYVSDGKDRQMAHNVAASQTYLGCYKPNIWWTKDQANLFFNKYIFEEIVERATEGSFGLTPSIINRESPLTDEEIKACETRHWSVDELYSKDKW